MYYMHYFAVFSIRALGTRYINRKDLKPLPLTDWESFAGAQLAQTGGDLSKCPLCTRDMAFV
jgi:hypothetical protein